MTKTVFTSISPLPAGISRQQAVEFLHSHQEMIGLNPLVVEQHSIEAPAGVDADERSCSWYSICDRIRYLPGDRVASNVTYRAAFHNLPRGLQTHCYAPLGVHIRSRWTVAGALPGEPPEPVELGIPAAPRVGLYLREDVDLRANILMTAFVKKTLRAAHAVLVDRLKLRVRAGSSAAAPVAAAPPEQRPPLPWANKPMPAPPVETDGRPPTPAELA